MLRKKGLVRSLFSIMLALMLMLQPFSVVAESNPIDASLFNEDATNDVSLFTEDVTNDDAINDAVQVDDVNTSDPLNEDDETDPENLDSSDITSEITDDDTDKLDVTLSSFIPFSETVSDEMYIIGSHDLGAWTPANAKKMTKSGDSYTLTLNLPANDYEFKYFQDVPNAPNGGWEYGYPGGNQSFTLTAESDVSFSFIVTSRNDDGTVKDYTHSMWIDGVPPIPDEIYLIGNHDNLGNWNGDAKVNAKKLTKNGNVYTLKVSLPAGSYQYKYMQDAPNFGWDYNYGPSSNYGFTLDAPADVTFTFTVTAWHTGSGLVGAFTQSNDAPAPPPTDDEYVRIWINTAGTPIGIHIWNGGYSATSPNSNGVWIKEADATNPTIHVWNTQHRFSLQTDTGGVNTDNDGWSYIKYYGTLNGMTVRTANNSRTYVNQGISAVPAGITDIYFQSDHSGANSGAGLQGEHDTKGLWTKDKEGTDPVFTEKVPDEICIIGDGEAFGNWNAANAKKMTKDGDVYTITIPLKKGSYPYKFLQGGPEYGFSYELGPNNYKGGDFVVDVYEDADVTFTLTAITRVGGIDIDSNLVATFEQSNNAPPIVQPDGYNGTLGSFYSTASTEFKFWDPDAESVHVVLYAGTLNYTTEGVHFENLKTAGRGNARPIANLVNWNVDMTSTGITKARHAMTKDPATNLWTVTVPGNHDGKYYLYQIDDKTYPDKDIHSDRNPYIPGYPNYYVDPYARAVSANGRFGVILDWDDPAVVGTVRPLDKTRFKLQDEVDHILMELHVRDFSIHSSSGVSAANQGKYLAFTEKGTTVNSIPGGIKTGIDHLIDLGITTVHLMPVYDIFSVNEVGPLAYTNESENAFNWGYDPQNFNVPEGSYSTDPTDPAVRIREFKAMVSALHEAGISVVMDVVYNHTHNKTVFGWNPDYWYRGSDSSGCGNTTRSEFEMVRKYIIDSVLYWQKEYGIDGFRFDLMACHDVETMKQVTAALKAADPDTIIYGEPWSADWGKEGIANIEGEDSRPTYMGTNRGHNFAAFNDIFRDLLKGNRDGNNKGFATNVNNPNGGANIFLGVQGSPGNSTNSNSGWKTDAGADGTAGAFTSRPGETVNYASAHDNLILWDKLMGSFSATAANADNFVINHNKDKLERVTYHANPYGDGKATAQSSEMPVTVDMYADGKAAAKLINGIVLTSQGIPFFHAGDELLRSKGGFHDSYHAGDNVNSIKWDQTASQRDDFTEYFKGLIKLRQDHPAFRIQTQAGVSSALTSIRSTNSLLVYSITGSANNDDWNDIYVAYNGSDKAQNIGADLPANLRVVVNNEFAGTKDLGSRGTGDYDVPAYSMVVLVDGYKIALNDGVGAKDSSESIVVSHGKKIAAKVAIPTRSGYVFQGYYAEPNGGGTRYYAADGKRVFDGNMVLTDNETVFYADWKALDPPAVIDVPEEKEIILVDDSIFTEADGIIMLEELDGNAISDTALQTLKDLGIEVTIELESGLKLSIDPAFITEDAIAVNLDIDIDFVTSGSQIKSNGNDVQVGGNSLIITPATHGEYGFQLSIHISSEQLAMNGITGNNIKLYYVDSNGKITQYSDLTHLKRNEDGSVTITIDHASRYILTDEEVKEIVPEKGGSSNNQNKNQNNNQQQSPATNASAGTVTSASQAAAANLSLENFSANNAGIKMSVGPIKDGTVIEKLSNQAETLLAGLGTVAQNSKGEKAISVIGALDVNIGTNQSVVANFTINKGLSYGKKVIAMVLKNDGTVSYAPVDVDVANGNVKVKLTSDAKSVVFISYTPIHTGRISRIRNEQLRAVFDAEYYATRNPDVVAVLGRSTNALFNHFLRHGLSEGRAGSAEFDVSYYRMANPDLEKAFGNDNALYVLHWLRHGRSEERLGGIGK